jgi:hypothetical protein
MHACCRAWTCAFETTGHGQHLLPLQSQPCKYRPGEGQYFGFYFQAALEDAREQAAAAQRAAADGESRALELESNLAKHKAVYVASTAFFSLHACMHGAQLYSAWFWLWQGAQWPQGLAAERGLGSIVMGIPKTAWLREKGCCA